MKNKQAFRKKNCIGENLADREKNVKRQITFTIKGTWVKRDCKPLVGEHFGKSFSEDNLTAFAKILNVQTF